ncbi:MAG: M14 family metallopeptidase [Maribacter sp.]|nr:M14 family metallopeptidase [Maribacter sp.]
MMVSPEIYNRVSEKSIKGRYVVHGQIVKFLKSVRGDFKVATVGKSVEERSIVSIKMGNGSKRILMWSQMHGNESTTTKAVLDLVNFLASGIAPNQKILEECTICILPILNPDGAERYTRQNAKLVDLNRDAQTRSQPESEVLRKVYEEFDPHFCFNLHDQRTIFNVGTTPMPATLSFLAPAHDEQRSISKTRGISMQLIVAINKMLQKIIPGQIGRYDDAFNINCVGDTFQSLKIPTVLVEAGHFQNDYQREETRAYVFQALYAALFTIASDRIDNFDYEDYFVIPENEKRFFDILIKRVDIVKATLKSPSDMGLRYAEVLDKKHIAFVPEIDEIGNLAANYGHKVFNCLDDVDLERLKKEAYWHLITS